MTFSEESTKIDKLLERTRYFRYIELFYTRRVVYVTQFAREELIRDSHKYFLISLVMYRNFKSKISFLGYKIVTVVFKCISVKYCSINQRLKNIILSRMMNERNLIFSIPLLFIPSLEYSKNYLAQFKIHTRNDWAIHRLLIFTLICASFSLELARTASNLDTSQQIHNSTFVNESYIRQWGFLLF